MKALGVLLDDGKYQILESLYSEQGYAASVCIDIETKNNYKEYVFNVYSDPAQINTYLPLFHELRSGICGDYRELLPGNSCIMAVFDYHKGVPLESYFNKLKKDDYPARAQAVGSFFEAAIILDAMPSVFALSALNPPYTVYNLKDGAVRFNFVIRPRAEPSPAELREIFIPYIESAFTKNRYLPESAVEFLERLRSGELTGFVSVCAAWRRISAKAMEEHEAYKEESLFKYIKRKLSRKAKDKLKKQRAN